MRRQMQAGVRKKELLDRINSKAPNQGPIPSHIPSVQQNQQTPHPVVQQQPQPPQQPEQQQQQQLPPQQQRTPQLVNQSLKNPNQGPPISPNGAAQTPIPRPNVKTRLQMVKGNNQQQQTLGPGPDQQWNPPQQNQQQPPPRRNTAVQNVNRPGTQIQTTQVPPKNIPVTSSLGPGQAQTPGPKPGAKRTVMQRAKNSAGEAQQVPQKVRVVKLSGAVSIWFHFYLTPFFLFLSNSYLILFQLIFYPHGK